ncbi:leucine-rich repeat domain-containing protein [Enterococcus sp. B1E4]|nr:MULTISPECIES: leucine-rich repeat domain-containing protein [unclassified Enterococcus]MDO0896424.1 leucine-rich repeat domain-containing protein [Enterococcus sp. B1E4]MDO0909190.1 leucine-rich repeat domain-containing protein [Enterococcus sp. B2E4]
MTNGASQGLFVVIAIIIFGIFVLISYSLFQDTLQPSLAKIFTSNLEQVETIFTDNDSLDVSAENEDSKYIYAKIREENESKNETAIWVRAEKMTDGNLRIDSSSTTNSNYQAGGSADMKGNLILPDTINGKKIIGIGPENVLTAGTVNTTFSNAQFTGEIRLPNHLEYISHMVFYNSTFSGQLNLPKNLRVIGGRAFMYSTFEGRLQIPDTLTEIGTYTFDKSMFNGELVLPQNLKVIATGAFRSSYFDGTLNVTNITAIQNSAFRDSRIEHVIRGENEMSDGSVISNPKGIHPRAIKLANGDWYNGSNT